MTKTIPYFAAAVEADENGEPMPAFFRHDLGFGTADDVAGLIVWLASDAAAGVTGQAIGVGGDRLQVWRHPEVAASYFHEGGWSADAIQSELADEITAQLQSVGEPPFPPLPPELDRPQA
jgi:3-oxoacyl-[acyl-carrier protein] reductase